MNSLQFLTFIVSLCCSSAFFKFGNIESLNVCHGSTAMLDFGYNTDESVSAIEWYFNTTSEPIHIAHYNFEADMQQRKTEPFKIFGTYSDRVTRSNESNAAILLKQVAFTDEGEYFFAVQTKSKLHRKSLKMTVLKPPTEPIIFPIKREDGSTEVICRLPVESGMPPVDVHLEDDHGFQQSSQKITISDDNYKCCMTGYAVACFNNLNKIRYCVSMRTELQCSENPRWRCVIEAFFTCAGLSCIVFIGWSVVILYINERHRKNWKGKKTKFPTPVRSAGVILLVSQTLNVCIALLCCYVGKGCKNTETSILVGIVCFCLVAVLAIFLSIAYNIADAGNREIKKKKDDIDQGENRINLLRTAPYDDQDVERLEQSSISSC